MAGMKGGRAASSTGRRMVLRARSEHETEMDSRTGSRKLQFRHWGREPMPEAGARGANPGANERRMANGVAA